MSDKNSKGNHFAKLGPFIFILTCVLILEFFWWFIPAG